jgi:transposase
MEGCNGALRPTGHIVETDSDLHRRSNGKDSARRRSSFRPEAIAAFIVSHSSNITRVGLEAGAASTWLWTELNKLGLPVICIDARHAKAALKMQINKSDRNEL